jgi:hypothetical protein
MSSQSEIGGIPRGGNRTALGSGGRGRVRVGGARTCAAAEAGVERSRVGGHARSPEDSRVRRRRGRGISLRLG